MDLLPENELAVRVWRICHVMGREGANGVMQAVNVVAVLTALGGEPEDLEKVMLIESIYQEQRREGS